MDIKALIEEAMPAIYNLFDEIMAFLKAFLSNELKGEFENLF